MRTLVLSGGGSRGAWQVGALEYLLGEAGKEYDLVCGVSVGALNGAFLAMWDVGSEIDAIASLSYLWDEVDNDFVFEERFFGKLASLWSPSVYRTDPLQKVLNNRLDLERLKTSSRQLSVGAVSLNTGEYRRWRSNDPNIRKAVLASASFPGMFPPVKIDGQKWIDGGLRHTTPFRDAVDLGASEVDVLSTFPPKLDPTRTVSTVLESLPRMIEILTTEIDHSDLSYSAEDGSFDEEDIPTTRVLRPSSLLEVNPLSFDPDEIEKMRNKGYEDASNWSEI